MAKLTDAQLVVLSKAAQREDRAVELPAQLTTRLIRALEALIERGLLEDVASERAMPVWRHARDDNEPRSLVVTALGLSAIGIGADEPHISAETAPIKSTKGGTAKPAKPKPAKPGSKAKGKAKTKVGRSQLDADTATKARAHKTGKTAAVIKLLERKDGASIEMLSEATGWLPHSTRAALTGLRKKGYEVERGKAKDKTTTIYRIVKVPADKVA